MRIVPINSVKNGAMLATDLYSENGDILLKKGVILTNSLINRIKSNGIYSVYVNDGFIDEEIQDVIKPEVRQKAIKAIKETFKQIEAYHQQYDIKNTSFNQRLKMKAMEKYLTKLKGVSEFIVDDITKSHQLMVNLIDIKSLNNFLYQHVLEVALLATVIGIELRMTKHQLHALFLGAVLHDIGMLFVDSDNIMDYNNSTSQEQEDFSKHTILGYQYLTDNYHFDIETRLIALQHHERIDGEGYPYGKTGDQLHLFSKIVAVCDFYDEMVSDMPERPGQPANEVFEYIMGAGGRQFDYDIVDIFSRKINPYPIGTLIQLSDGKSYIVVKNNVDFPTRPIVKEVDIAAKKITSGEINLLETNTITINKIIR